MLNGISDRLERYMDLLSARQQLVSANIANADTPGYHTRDIDFQSEFRREAMGGGSMETIEPQGLKVKNDGNNVSVDREARLLAENAIRFNIASQLVRMQIRNMRSAIQDGRGQ